MAKRASATQADKVRAALEEDILRGVLLPGTVLEEGRIAEQYDVSRTPVREAINQLVFAGLVEKPARRRAVVCEMDTSKLLELFEVLAELEGFCAALAAERMSDKELRELQEVHDGAQAALDVEGSGQKYVGLGRRFHELITDGCRNRELIAITQRLGNRLFPYRRYQAMAPGRLRANQAEHDAIVDAIVKRDPEAARRAMQGHATRQGDLLVRYIALHKVTHSDLTTRRRRRLTAFSSPEAEKALYFQCPRAKSWRRFGTWFVHLLIAQPQVFRILFGLKSTFPRSGQMRVP